MASPEPAANPPFRTDPGACAHVPVPALRPRDDRKPRRAAYAPPALQAPAPKCAKMASPEQLIATIDDDEAWLAGNEDVEWDDTASDEPAPSARPSTATQRSTSPRTPSTDRPPRPSSDLGDEQMLAAAQACIYELEGDGWRPLAGGEWVTLYLVEAPRGLRVAALDPEAASDEMVMAAPLNHTASVALHDDEAGSSRDASGFCELSTGAGDVVYGLRFEHAAARATTAQ
eukprot:CAMPEP_0119269484 /NCGR_PEP_ID=MMETSP1329-20130426/6881_1 /TAXON_ID=114041 /ORGANISM="Genus nov. species nov., Strain RCC1024" /LENGTH=229 /DNA_ID=CAMNT_0007269483 /DNA_START=12 /DNA_END=698 /DNA_ORIENTATION=-